MDKVNSEQYYKWVKASEEPEFNTRYNCLIHGKVPMVLNFEKGWGFYDHENVFYNPTDVEWLKPVERQQSQQPEIPEDIENLQNQVREHIGKHNLFDWSEALTENEMTYLEDLLLTFNPLCPPGSIGFEEQKRHIAALQQKGNDDSDGWISVETVPPEDEWILLYNGFWTGVGKYNKHEDEDDYEPEWMDETMAYINDIPTHWQPLPAPPKK